MEHRDESRGEDAISGDLTVGEFAADQTMPLLRLTDEWGRVDHRTRVSTPSGVVRRVRVAVNRI